MNWENVLPTTTMAATIAGLLWCLARLFRPMAVEVARDATDRLRTDLQANDFHAVDQRFDRVDRRFDRVDTRLDRVEERLDGVDQRFRDVDARFDVIDARFDVIDARFDMVDARFEGVDNGFVGMDQRMDRMDQRMDRMSQSITDTRTELGARIGDVQAEVRELRTRMEHNQTEILEAIRSRG